MGSTREFRKQAGRNPDPQGIETRRLACGCETDQAPDLSRPDKWWCCGAYQRAKKTPS